MIHKSRILKPTLLQSLLSPFLPAYFISTESVGMEKIYFRVLCKQTTKQRKKEIAEREQTTCQPRQQSLYICIWITVVNKSWGSNSKSARALKKKSHESERILKITVVYKTQIWQDHQSVYRNTNTIMKRVKRTVFYTRHVQATVKKDLGMDGWWLGHFPSMSLKINHI